MNLPLKIRELAIPKEKYQLKCPYPMKADRIVIHNTANSASALNEAKFSRNNDWEVSSHFYVDESECVKSVNLDRNAWHAGDGSQGLGNRKGIAIEICRSQSNLKTFKEAEKNAAILSAYLLKENDWTLDRISKHQDYSGKYCPHKTLDLGWQRFLNMVQDEYNKLNPLVDYILCYYNDGDQALAEAMLSVLGDNSVLTKTTDASGLRARVKIQIGGFPIKGVDCRLAGKNRIETFDHINKWLKKNIK